MLYEGRFSFIYMVAITFGEIKQYVSRTVRVSVCFRDGKYDNYTMISDIADGQYDNLYVYGIGMADVEFPLDVYKRLSVGVPEKLSLKDGFYLGCGLEIVLQDEPRDIPRQDEWLLYFQDLRGYLQIGMNFWNKGGLYDICDVRHSWLL